MVRHRGIGSSKLSGLSLRTHLLCHAAAENIRSSGRGNHKCVDAGMWPETRRLCSAPLAMRSTERHPLPKPRCRREILPLSAGAVRPGARQNHRTTCWRSRHTEDFIISEILNAHKNWIRHGCRQSSIGASVSVNRETQAEKTNISQRSAPHPKTRQPHTPTSHFACVSLMVASPSYMDPGSSRRSSTSCTSKVSSSSSTTEANSSISRSKAAAKSDSSHESSSSEFGSSSASCASVS